MAPTPSLRKPRERSQNAAQRPWGRCHPPATPYRRPSRSSTSGESPVVGIAVALGVVTPYSLKRNPATESVMSQSDTRLRRMIGLLGLLLPWVLLVGGFLAPKRIGWQSAISDYYHTHVGYLFVGIMLAIGAFLICYKGGDDSDENRWTNFGGWMAILVAIFPPTSMAKRP